MTGSAADCAADKRVKDLVGFGTALQGARSAQRRRSIRPVSVQ